MGEVKVLNTATPNQGPQVTVTYNGSTASVAELFIPKADFSENAPPDLQVCYVIDGGDSQTQPCDE